jgi:hypothetical protein
MWCYRGQCVGMSPTQRQTVDVIECNRIDCFKWVFKEWSEWY